MEASSERRDYEYAAQRWLLSSAGVHLQQQEPEYKRASAVPAARDPAQQGPARHAEQHRPYANRTLSVFPDEAYPADGPTA